LGNDFTAEVKQAWAQCYTTMADAMICGADESVVK
jgi:hemoglobin-like flavoprotein